MAERDINSLLSKLGLTEYESKTLGTLFRIGESEAPAVSRLAQVPKTRVYDVLDKLVERNLVIEIRGRPKRYRSVDAKKAFNLLIESKKSELESLQKNVSSLETMLLTNSEKELMGETVMKVKDKRDFETILGQEISKAKTSLTGFAAFSFFLAFPVFIVFDRLLMRKMTSNLENKSGDFDRGVEEFFKLPLIRLKSVLVSTLLEQQALKTTIKNKNNKFLKRPS